MTYGLSLAMAVIAKKIKAVNPTASIRKSLASSALAPCVVEKSPHHSSLPVIGHPA
jgi:hypothetical protein